MYEHLTIDELQNTCDDSNEQALIELGRRVVDKDFCFIDDTKYCEHEIALQELEMALEEEPPLECPHCEELLSWETRSTRL